MSNCLICYKDAGDAEYHSNCSKKIFGTSTMPVLEFNKELLRKLAEQTVSRQIAIPGVQPKISLTIAKKENRLTIVGLWGEYILKPQQDQFALMPETEDLTMHLAEVFDIPVCQHTLLRATDNQLVYIAKRFDRIGTRKIHMEDFCQLSEFPTENKYKGSYERAGKLITQHCTNSGLDLIRYFELLLFCYLTANSDMHLKNFSLIYNDNRVQLSPAYDLLNVRLVFPQDQEETALLFNGRRKNITLKDFELLGNSLDINEKARNNIYKKFSSRNNIVYQTIEASFLNDAAKGRYAEIWKQKQKIF